MVEKVAESADESRGRRIGVVGRHVLAHDVGGVAGDLETSLEAVLQAHARNRFGRDAIPSGLAADQAVGLRNLALIGHVRIPLSERYGRRLRQVREGKGWGMAFSCRSLQIFDVKL
mgnify:CR=1 FL=1